VRHVCELAPKPARPATALPPWPQVVRSPYAGVWDCVSRTMRTEGLGAFFRSYRTTARPRRGHRRLVGRRPWLRSAADAAQARRSS